MEARNAIPLRAIPSDRHQNDASSIRIADEPGHSSVKQITFHRSEPRRYNREAVKAAAPVLPGLYRGSAQVVEGMIERVARRLCLIEYPDQSLAWHDDAWKEWITAALDVVRTMREPTAAMVAAIHEALPEENAYGWRTMIDAALAEDPDTGSEPPDSGG